MTIPANDPEKAFLETYDPTAFDRPSVTVDVVLLSVVDDALHTLLVRRQAPPFEGHWALPGGFVRMDEPLTAAAERVLAHKTGLEDVFLEQLYTFGHPGRDPRMRILSVAYYALVDARRFRRRVNEAEVSKLTVPWEGETGGPVEAAGADGRLIAFAFDHADILGMAVRRIRGKLDYTPIGFQLLPSRFTLRELQHVHETVLGRPLNKDSFRRRMLASGQLEATGEHQRDVGHRPAELYRFAKRSAV